MVTRMRPSLRGALHQPHMQRTARQIVAVQAHSCPAMLLASYQTRPISGGVKMVSCSSLGPRNRLHITCNAGSTAQSLSSSSGKGSVVLIDDSALCDTSGIVVGTAWLAAIQLWPGHIVGSAALYLSKARAILPVLNQPFEAVILMRLMADEGVIGGF